MHGCDGEPVSPRLDERYPGAFPFEVSRCPMWLLKQPDHYVDTVVRMYSDREKGVLPGWPDDYSAAIVEGVRSLTREINAAQSEDMQRRRQEMDRKKGAQRG